MSNTPQQEDQQSKQSNNVRWDLRGEMNQYLRDHQVEGMLTSLVEAICLHRPQHVAQFSVDFLRRHYLQNNNDKNSNIDESGQGTNNRRVVKVRKKKIRNDESSSSRQEEENFGANFRFGDQTVQSIAESEKEHGEHGGDDGDENNNIISLKAYQLGGSPSAAAHTRSPMVEARRPSTPYSDKDDFDEIDFYESERRRRRYSVSVPERRGGVSAESMSVTDLDQQQRVIHEKSKDEKSRLRDALSRVALFKSLDDEDIQSIFDAMFETTVPAGEHVIHQNDEGDNFYVVDTGHCEIYLSPNEGGSPRKVLDVGPGGTFGELALMFGVPRAASVVAKTDCRLWALDRMTYRKIIMGQTLKKRHLYEGLLRQIHILQPLMDYERLTIADALQIANYKDGENVVQEGEPGSKFYIVVNGELKVSKHMEGKEAILTTLHRSDYFGELALLFDQPRAATVTAVGDVKLAWLDRNSFKKLLGPCEDILRRNSELYSKYIAGSI